MSCNLKARFNEVESKSWTQNFAASLWIVQKKSFEFIRIYQQIDVKMELERAPSAKGARNTTVTCAPVFSSLPLGGADKVNGKGTERRSMPIHCWMPSGQGLGVRDGGFLCWCENNPHARASRPSHSLYFQRDPEPQGCYSVFGGTFQSRNGYRKGD